jgi:four helix bundle protein
MKNAEWRMPSDSFPPPSRRQGQNLQSAVPTDLKQRTKRFSLRALEVVEALPDNTVGRIIRNQLGRAGTSVGANYRAACRARSLAEFIAKLGNVIEEADESAFWIELTMERRLLEPELLRPVWDEANQLVAIMTQSRKTAEANLARKRRGTAA